MNTYSSSGKLSRKEFSTSTGPTRSSVAISDNLLPTPEARNQDGYQRSGGTEWPRLGRVIATLSPEDFLVSRSATREEDKERMMTAISGQKCLSASGYSDQHGSSLKMLRDSLLGTTGWYSRQCALTWKKKDTKYNRLLFQLAPSVRPTDATACGLSRTMLPTSSANDWKGAANSPNYHNQPRIQDIFNGAKTGLKLQPAFALWMMGYPEDWLDLEAAEADARAKMLIYLIEHSFIDPKTLSL